MPTIEISRKLLEKMCRKKVTEKDFEIVKGEASFSGDRITLELGDTNRPDLWSIEGVARVIRGYYGMPSPSMKTAGTAKKIIVDKKLRGIRPFIAGFGAIGISVTDDLLKDIIQMQEKISENYGRKRQKISIGVYNYDFIKFPLHYRAARRDESFVPLGMSSPMSLRQILEEHPTGMKYGYVIKDSAFYPLFTDSKNEVLSFPPIINSSTLGKVEHGMKNLFVEVTGNDIKQVAVVANILAFALFDRGAGIEPVTVEYPWKTNYGMSVRTPFIKQQVVKVDRDFVKSVLWIDLPDKEIRSLLERMQYKVVFIDKKHVRVLVPPYRNDIMHQSDVVEDIAICYGYNNFEPLDIKSFTPGSLSSATIFSERLKRILVGSGFQEIMSFILTSGAADEKMLLESDSVEIENYMSESYSHARSWLIPSLLGFLSKNLHIEFPQRIFEIGECVVKDAKSSDGTRTLVKIAGTVSGNGAGYEDISSYVDAILSCLGINYVIESVSHPSFIEGRVGEIFIGGKKCGMLGEIHPKVLNNWPIEKPVVAFEMDMDALLKASG